jgi:4-hydroxy-tetrahydrodipicolinate synthase
LLVGISDTSVTDSIRLSKVAETSGAYAVVSAAPYYFASGQPELIDFYQTLIPKLGLPVFLYNMPSHTKVSFSPDSVKIIAENEKVIGFKDSSANGAYFQSVMYEMRHRKDFAIFVGPEEMTGEVVLMGASGGVNGGANIFPKLYVEMYKAAKSGDIESVRELQKLVMQVSSTIYNHGKFGSSFLMGVKCALSLLGICSGELAKPFSKFGENERFQIRQALEKLSNYPFFSEGMKLSLSHKG